jgi:eukaryotic-like serine/threonine-protein kinase
LREAVRLRPGSAADRSNLGAILAQQGDVPGAIAVLKDAIRLKPDEPSAHFVLGALLCDKVGDYEGAVLEFRAAIRLKPAHGASYYNLGNALSAQGQTEAAIIAYRQATRFEPEYAEAHCNLGHKLREKALYVEAVTEFRRGHELGSKRPDWRYPSAQWVRDCEQMVGLEAKLPAILKGEAQPADAVERLAIAQMCYDKQLFAAAARFWSEAFRVDAKLADDMNAQNRYSAACAAALAGAAVGKDDPPPNDASRTKLRNQALNWLKADLAFWVKQLETSSPQSRASIVQTLQHWKIDSDLVPIRDPEALKRLPEDEQKTCRALWSDVDAALRRVSTQAGSD